MVSKRESTTYKHSRTYCNKICSSYSNSNERITVPPHSGRQQDCLSLSTKDERNDIISNDVDFQRNIGFSLESWDQNYCRISSELPECGSRLGVTKQFLRMETENLCVQIPMSTDRDTNNRYVCLKTDKPSFNILCLETRPILQSSRCISTGMASESGSICIPPIFTHKQSPKESGARGECNTSSSSSYMADPNLLSTSTASSETKFNIT